MIRSVKNRIRLGTSFLFLLVLLSGGFSIYYLSKVKQQSKNILRANYESLQGGIGMQAALDSIQQGNMSFINMFEAQLRKQEANITEPGENAATKDLRLHFNRLKAGAAPNDLPLLRSDLHRILYLNLAAIKAKNDEAERSAQEAMTVLITIVAFIFIIGFTFAINFPSILTTPIQKLTQAIREIGQRNYSHRIHLDTRDEFGELANSFNEMAERLEYFSNSNLSKLIFEKSRAEAVINSLKDASIGIDKSSRVLFANTQALQLLGLKSEETVGKSTEELSGRNDLFKFLIENESGNPFKIVVDGKENYYVKEAMDVSQGEATNKVIVLKNITSFKELDVAKTNFIATISHELKTPLASSDFSIKLLQDERIGKEEKSELLQQLKSDNQRMLRILSELLNMSQVEAGKIRLDIQSVSPAGIVDASIEAVAAPARERALTLHKQVQEGLPEIRVDAEKISWVLNNFLTNAIRYAPPESEISIRVAGNDRTISFAVTDKGQGIEEAYLDRVFERYFQVPGRSDKKGSGIGLAICKEFIDAMGGTIWVKSKLGEGSTFGFDMPVPKG